MEGYERRILERIDQKTEHLQLDLASHGAQLRVLERHDADKEARIRSLEEKEAVSRTDLRRWGILITLLVLGGLGVGTVVLKGGLDSKDSPTAAASGKAVPIDEVTP